MRLIVFDFDGTLTTKDSLNEFLKYAVSKKEYLYNMLIFLPFYILYRFKILKNDIVKQKLLEIFFKGYKEERFKKLACDFSLLKLDKILKEDIYQKLLSYKNGKDEVVIVSASLKCWLEPWCKKNSINLLCTEALFHNGVFTGRFLTKNCYGKEKVDRLKQEYNLTDFDEIISYGDSKGDEEIFKISSKYYKL